MANKRFERIYADVDVFCRDNNSKGISQLIERDDYDKIVDLLNELHEENIKLKQKIENQKNHQITLESKIHRMKEQFRRRKK